MISGGMVCAFIQIFLCLSTFYFEKSVNSVLVIMIFTFFITLVIEKCIQPWYCVKYIPLHKVVPWLRRDPNFVLKKIKACPHDVKEIPCHLWNCSEFRIEITKITGIAIAFMPLIYRTREILIEASKTFIPAIEYADDKSLSGNKEFALQLLSVQPKSYKHFDTTLLSDKEIIENAIEGDPWNYLEIPMTNRTEKLLVMAIKKIPEIYYNYWANEANNTIEPRHKCIIKYKEAFRIFCGFFDMEQVGLTKLNNTRFFFR